MTKFTRNVLSSSPYNPKLTQHQYTIQVHAQSMTKEKPDQHCKTQELLTRTPTPVVYTNTHTHFHADAHLNPKRQNAKTSLKPGGEEQPRGSRFTRQRCYNQRTYNAHRPSIDPGLDPGCSCCRSGSTPTNWHSRLARQCWHGWLGLRCRGVRLDWARDRYIRSRCTCTRTR